MDKFDELFNKVARHDQAGDPSASDLHISDAFEDIVFNKIGRRKKQIRRNIAISIIFMVFGGFFGYFISQNMRVDSARANIKNNRLLSKVDPAKSKKTEKTEVWASDDIYFSTYDEKANYAIEQVSATSYDEEI